MPTHTPLAYKRGPNNQIHQIIGDNFWIGDSELCLIGHNLPISPTLNQCSSFLPYLNPPPPNPGLGFVHFQSFISINWYPAALPPPPLCFLPAPPFPSLVAFAFPFCISPSAHPSRSHAYANQWAMGKEWPRATDSLHLHIWLQYNHRTLLLLLLMDHPISSCGYSQESNSAPSVTFDFHFFFHFPRFSSIF